MEFFEVETFCTKLAQKSQSQREDQDLASQIVVAKGERGILTEQLALKLLRSFRGLYRGEQLPLCFEFVGILHFSSTYQTDGSDIGCDRLQRNNVLFCCRISLPKSSHGSCFAIAIEGKCQRFQNRAIVFVEDCLAASPMRAYASQASAVSNLQDSA